jgi:methylisocitrate lyase
LRHSLEAAGFAAIELEGQLLPRRVEHHAGVNYLIPTELMLKKIAEAIAARSDPDFVERLLEIERRTMKDH